jgi:chromosome segregation ATPase
VVELRTVKAKDASAAAAISALQAQIANAKEEVSVEHDRVTAVLREHDEVAAQAHSYYTALLQAQQEVAAAKKRAAQVRLPNSRNALGSPYLLLQYTFSSV